MLVFEKKNPYKYYFWKIIIKRGMKQGKRRWGIDMEMATQIWQPPGNMVHALTTRPLKFEVKLFKLVE